MCKLSRTPAPTNLYKYTYYCTQVPADAQKRLEELDRSDPVTVSYTPQTTMTRPQVNTINANKVNPSLTVQGMSSNSIALFGGMQLGGGGPVAAGGAAAGGGAGGSGGVASGGSGSVSKTAFFVCFGST